GTLLAELPYTHLDRVTENEQFFNGEGHASCVDSADGTQPGHKWDGRATRTSLGVACLFEPEWLPVKPGLDLSMPVSLTYGISGNPAYAAGSFYAEDTKIYSIGIRGTYQQKHTVTLQYNGYDWMTSPKVTVPGLGESYSGFGGNGPVALNDKGWVALMYKTSF